MKERIVWETERLNELPVTADLGLKSRFFRPWRLRPVSSSVLAHRSPTVSHGNPPPIPAKVLEFWAELLQKGQRLGIRFSFLCTRLYHQSTAVDKTIPFLEPIFLGVKKKNRLTDVAVQMLCEMSENIHTTSCQSLKI